jgi:hypothetical protein
LKYKELQIIKHSLQNYITRSNAAEKRLLEKITLEVDEMKDKYGIS